MHQGCHTATYSVANSIDNSTTQTLTFSTNWKSVKVRGITSHTKTRSTWQFDNLNTSSNSIASVIKWFSQYTNTLIIDNRKLILAGMALISATFGTFFIPKLIIAFFIVEVIFDAEKIELHVEVFISTSIDYPRGGINGIAGHVDINARCLLPRKSDIRRDRHTVAIESGLIFELISYAEVYSSGRKFILPYKLLEVK